jgi:hypothetical protein
MKNLLDHVHDLFVLVEPEVVVWYGHPLEGHLLRVLEERVRPPNVLEKRQKSECVFW